MNRLFLSLFAIATMTLILACGDKAPDTVAANPEGEAAQATTSSTTYAVDVANSTMNWIGSKEVGQRFHTGTIAISNGSVNVEAGKLTAGSFTVDMNSINLTDQTPEDKKPYLIGHLKSDEFFNTEQYPTAKFTLTRVEPATDDSTATHHISGNLTLRDVTKEITIPANVSIIGSQLIASSKFAINRADFNVKYGSPTHILDIAKDEIINDEIEFTMKVVAHQQEATATK